METMSRDRLAVARKVPDVGALIDEFTLAQQSSLCAVDNIGAAEDVRFNRWEGKSVPPDGCRWQRNATRGTVVRPYDGRPDCDVQLPDEICSAEVDILMTALAQAQVGATTTAVTPLTAAQVAELRAVGQWIRRVVQPDLADDAELLAQMMTELGWSVLNPGWLERWELVERELTLPELVRAVAQLAGEEAGRQISLLVLDPTLEEQAVLVLRRLFGRMTQHTARKAVRELRAGEPTRFLDRQLAEKRPTVRALIQGYNYFVSGGATTLRRARGHLVVERFFEAELRAVARDNDWHESFVEAACGTAGQYSGYATAQREKSQRVDDSSTDMSIEIWTTSVLQFDPDTGAAGIYCTTFSPHLRPGPGEDEGEVAQAYYAKHYLLEFAHGRAPFVQARREVVGPTLNDSRGVPDMVQSDAKVIKTLQDASVARAHLDVDPPLALTGPGWSGSTESLGPGARIDSVMPGSEAKALLPTRADGKLAELNIQRVELATHRRFALPNARDGSHPSAWQMRQARNVRRWLGAWEEAYWQMAVLCYQELEAGELAQIIGRPPTLRVPDLLRHRLTLTFDVRSLDNDWTQTVLDFVIRLLGIDSAGLMDRAPIIQTALAYIDPAMVDSILRNPAGASAQLYRQVEGDVASIMDMNPPRLRENDASAGMQLQMAFAVVGKNPKYQEILRNAPQVQENFKAYLDNLQHNVQETQISPVQGRLGVETMPQVPVRRGNAMEAPAE